LTILKLLSDYQDVEPVVAVVHLHMLSSKNQKWQEYVISEVVSHINAKMIRKRY